MAGSEQTDLEVAEAAIVYARLVRKTHARRTDKRSNQRKKDINLALRRIKQAMAPLKSEIGRFQYGEQSQLAEAEREKVRAASDALQRERRKLWKMKNVKGGLK